MKVVSEPPISFYFVLSLVTFFSVRNFFSESDGSEILREFQFEFQREFHSQNQSVLSFVSLNSSWFPPYFSKLPIVGHADKFSVKSMIVQRILLRR